MLAINLTNFSTIWNKSYAHGIDSQAITSDCSKIYMPDGELSGTSTWHVVDAATGNETGTITSSSSHPHNTIVYNGHVYLAGRQSTVFQAAGVYNNAAYFTSNPIPHPGGGGVGIGVRPFTINSEETVAYATQTCAAPCSSPAFDVINLTNGVVTQKSLPSATCSSSCPSTPNHGIAMSPDEQKLYVLDAINNVVYGFNIGGANLYAPQLVTTTVLVHHEGGQETPCAYDCLGDGWLHISRDGKYLFVGDSGDVIDISLATPSVVAYFPQMNQTRKEIEIDCDTSIPISTGCNPVFAMNNRSSIGNPVSSGHVFIVMEENHNYSSIVGTTAMPYLNSLISAYGLATQYYANTHPSIGNYFMLTTGQILTNTDSMTPATFPVSADNVVRQLIAGGKTWKAYAEDLPSVGYTGGNSGNYAVRHNPLAYFTDVQNSSTQKQNLVPFQDADVGFAHDLANNSLPNYSFIVPNLNDDAHNGTLAQADTWLQTNIAPLLTGSQFPSDGVLMILFDEAASDSTNGGGRVVWTVIGPAVRRNYQSTFSFYQHQSAERLSLERLGLASWPGAGATAPSMEEFFTVVASSGPVPLTYFGMHDK
jgi:hypothetical protein